MAAINEKSLPCDVLLVFKQVNQQNIGTTIIYIKVLKSTNLDHMLKSVTLPFNFSLKS